ncbi:hypothetical protein WG902_01080 [Ramlibacter sp. PS3R-8]|uniref:hypothetical protein n=1 Tax=Ramlibacter sp. PS3R-8 TaxID=3133437 RepID=UPI0030A65507
MSALDKSAVEAIALQLVDALERYAADTTQLVANWPDLERYRSVSEQIDQIRLFVSGLPEARVQWVELLIAHAELVHLLWRAHYGHGGVTLDDTLHARLHHTDSVAALRSSCLRMVSKPQRPLSN